LYWGWDIEDTYASIIRPEDGETWGPIPWMDEKWIAENTIDEEVPAEVLALVQGF